MNIKSDTEYIAKTGHTIDADGNIPLEMKAELVRCIDCKHAQDAYIKSAKNVSETEKYCIILEDRVKNSHFCSYGERKEE